MKVLRINCGTEEIAARARQLMPGVEVLVEPWLGRWGWTIESDGPPSPAERALVSTALLPDGLG